jgi:hypothetical protein
MSKVLVMPPPTYKACLFTVAWEGKKFSISGTLDGYVDLALPDGGTYQLTPTEAGSLALALEKSCEDIERNCLYDED